MIKRNEPVKIMSTSDIHYLSPRLNDKGPLFKKTMNTADGKHTMFIEEIMDAFVDAVKEEHPDFLLISGDLTFNGEKDSHEDLANILSQLQKEGIQPLVIPGNHDVEYPFAYKYCNDCFFQTENIDAKTFARLYDACGYGGALSRDPTSLSYVYAMSEDLWLFALDANVNGHKGQLSSATLKWAEHWLKKAVEEEVVIFTMTHQNILSHNLLTSPGYVLFNNDEVFELLTKYNATLNFSGHMHIQHIKTVDKFTTIASGSLAVSPNLYGVLTIDPQRWIDYTVHALDVEGWARKKGICNHRLQDFSRESRTYFNGVWGWQINQELEDFHIPPIERVGLVDFCARVLNCYLAGQTWKHRREFLEDPLYKKWKEKAAGSYFGAYLESILEDPSNSISDTHLHLHARQNRKAKDCCC